MSMDEEQFVTVTAYDTEPVKVIHVPAHYTFIEICEAIQSEMTDHTTDPLTFESSNCLSSTIIASGEFSSVLTPPDHKCPKALGQAR